MTRRVFLHVGVPKTGTTFLQTAMWHNRRQLEMQGFLYPGTSRMDHYPASRVVREASPAALGEHADAWDRIVDELAAWEGDALVSHEFFSMATRAQAARAVAALAPAEVTVVLTARDYVRQFPAVWQEALKMNSGASLDEFMKQVLAREAPGAWGWRSQDVPAVLERWSEAVPAERLHVITVPPPGAPRDLLWRRWCDVLGIDDSAFNMDLSVGNESLGVVQAALMHRLKPHLSGPLERGPVRHRWVRQYFGHEVLVPQRGERFGPRPEDVAELRRLSIAMSQAIEQAGYPVTGDLAELVPAENPPALPHPDDVTDAEMLDAAVRAIEQMIRDVRDLTTSRRAWREKAQSSTRRRAARLARRAAGRAIRRRR